MIEAPYDPNLHLIHFLHLEIDLNTCTIENKVVYDYSHTKNSSGVRLEFFEVLHNIPYG